MIVQSSLDPVVIVLLFLGDFLMHAANALAKAEFAEPEPRSGRYLPIHNRITYF